MKQFCVWCRANFLVDSEEVPFMSGTGLLSGRPTPGNTRQNIVATHRAPAATGGEAVPRGEGLPDVSNLQKRNVRLMRGKVQNCLDFRQVVR